MYVLFLIWCYRSYHHRLKSQKFSSKFTFHFQIRLILSGPSGYSFEPKYSEEELRQMEEASPTVLQLYTGYSYSILEEELANMKEASPAVLPMERGASRTDHRVNIAWCSCQFCSVMPTIKECICCREMTVVTNFLGLDKAQPLALQCITMNEDFKLVCLNRAVLRAAYTSIAEMARWGEAVAIPCRLCNR